MAKVVELLGTPCSLQLIARIEELRSSKGKSALYMAGVDQGIEACRVIMSLAKWAKREDRGGRLGKEGGTISWGLHQ